MLCLLLVETDPFLKRTYQKLFTEEGYACMAAAGEREALRSLVRDDVDLVILDAGLLPEHGLRLLRQIRADYHTPILMLAPRREVVDTVAGLTVGADDYLCEPFDPRELLARTRAQLRRAQEYREAIVHDQQIGAGDLLVDLKRRDAFRAGVPLHLTAREFELLHLFARHPNEALRAEQIVESVWGVDAQVGSKTLAVQVGRLRRKLEVDPHQPRLLISVRGFGYQFATAGPATPR